MFSFWIATGDDTALARALLEHYESCYHMPPRVVTPPLVVARYLVLLRAIAVLSPVVVCYRAAIVPGRVLSRVTRNS